MILVSNFGDERAARRARWHNYFEQRLLGPDRELRAATDAAMDAVDQGFGQKAIIEAGLAAAKRVRGGGAPPFATASPRPGSGQAPGASRVQRAPAFQPHAKPIPAAGSAHPANSGVVSLIEKRTESLDGQFFQVWSFRLMRLNEGQQVGPAIPVEIRGRSIIGQLTQGDVVEIPAGRAGGTRIVKLIRNHTTQSTIQAKGRPFRRSRTLHRTWKLVATLLKTIFGLIALAAVVVIAYFVLSEMNIITWMP